MENPIILFSKKLLAPMSTRVPLEVQEVFDKLAESQGCDRAKLLREAIDLKIAVETGQSSSEYIEKSKNTSSTSVFKNVCRNLKSFWQALKKPDVAGRASSTAIHNHSGK
jgi:hypothetical protein